MLWTHTHLDPVYWLLHRHTVWRWGQVWPWVCPKGISMLQTQCLDCLTVSDHVLPTLLQQLQYHLSWYSTFGEHQLLLTLPKSFLKPNHLPLNPSESERQEACYTRKHLQGSFCKAVTNSTFFCSEGSFIWDVFVWVKLTDACVISLFTCDTATKDYNHWKQKESSTFTEIKSELEHVSWAFAAFGVTHNCNIGKLIISLELLQAAGEHMYKPLKIRLSLIRKKTSDSVKALMKWSLTAVSPITWRGLS